jgi:hypothetical protein
MTASRKPKTPSMTMKVRPGTSPEDIDLFCKRASRVTLSQIVDNVTVREQLTVDGQARRIQFTVDIAFFPKEEYQAEYDVEPSEILASFATKFPLLLKKETQIEMKRLDSDLKSQIAELGKGKKGKTRDGDVEGDEDDGAPLSKKDDGEGSEVGDGDADDTKRARQRKQQATYDDDDDEEDDEGEYEDTAIEAAYAANGEDDSVEMKKPSGSLKSQANIVGELFKSNLQQASSFKFSESRCNFQLQVSHLL